MRELATIGDALEFLHDLPGMDPAKVLDFKVAGALSKLSIYVDGPDYHASFPGEFARGLWEFQDAIYNAVAFAFYGVADLRKLTDVQRKNFEIVFEVSEGSLDIQGLMEKFFEKLGEGFASMDSKAKAYTIVASVVAIMSGWGAVHLIDTNADVRKAEIEAEAKRDNDKAHLNQMKILAEAVNFNAATKAFGEASETGAKAIVKRASGATEIRYGAVSLDAAAIEEVNQRAAKERAQARIIEDDFVVVRVETRENVTTKLVLASAKHPEFAAVLQDEDFGADQMNKLWDAIKSRRKVRLEVNATYVREAIKSAQIVSII